MNTLSQLIRVTLDQKHMAAQILARAFCEDPLMKFVVPDERKRADLLPWLFGTVVHYCFLYGEIAATPNLEGVICWLPPGQANLTLQGIFRSGMFALRFHLGFAEIRRFLANERYTGTIHKQIVPEKHWYLWAVGVDPAYQGRGIGGMLLAQGLERASADGVPCYLETHNPKNLAFYKKFGFEIGAAGTLPKHGLRVWAMVRKP